MNAMTRPPAHGRTAASRRAAAAAASTETGKPGDHRNRQRVGGGGRRGGPRLGRPVRARPAADPPAGRAVRAARRRDRHDRPAREVDGRAWPDGRAVVPDGRAAPAVDGRRARRPGRRRRRRARAGSAWRRGALPAGRRRAGTAGRPLRAAGAGAALRARDLASPRLRPRGSRGRSRDVRAAGGAAPGLARERRRKDGKDLGYVTRRVAAGSRDRADTRRGLVRGRAVRHGQGRP